MRQMMVVGLAGLALAGGACREAVTNVAAGNGAASNVAVDQRDAGPSNGAEAEAAGIREAEAAARRRAEDEAGNATGPVTLAADGDLPGSCRAYVAAIQACINRVRGASSAARFRERHLRSGLHRHRTETWPGWARANYLERGCGQQLESIDTTYPGYGC